MYSLTALLEIRRGDVAAIVGCGGKTSLMLALTQENRTENAVLFGPTTHINPPDKALYDKEFTSGGTIFQGKGATLAHGGMDGQKLRGLPETELSAIVGRFDYVFLEADGSRSLPLKGWAEHDPVLPEFTSVTLAVAVLSPLGAPLSEQNTHRLECFCRLTGARPGDIVTLRHIAAMIANPGGMLEKARGRRVLLLNQIESDAALSHARELVALLPEGLLSRVVAGSLRLNRFQRIK